MPTDGDPKAIADATASFLEDRDNGEHALKAVLATDAVHETWTFDDVDLDSGTFGELVSRDIVTKANDAYHVAEPAIVESVVAGEKFEPETGKDSPRFNLDLVQVRRRVDPRALVALLGALFVVASARMTAFRSVFRDGHVVSPGNDPYYFRYWMEELVATASGPADYEVLIDAPHGVSGVRPLAHATNWFFAELLGGGQGAADTVVAWLPVAASVALGLMIYKLAVLLTRDIRVGVASVLVFAVTPIHAVYTGLGFLDHNAHQYFWLGLTLLTLAWLAIDLQRRLEGSASQREGIADHLRSPLTWVLAIAFGASIAAGTHTWGGSPLLLVPLAAYIGLRVALDARDGVPPARANLPLLGGLALGSTLALVLHYHWGWHATFVAVTPLLVFGGAIAVTALGELWRRSEVHIGGLLAVEGLLAAGGLYAFRWFRPEEWTEAMARANDLFFRNMATSTVSLFSTEYFVIFGPLYQLGMGFYIALGVFGWVLWVVSRRYEPGWLLIGTYTGYLLVLAGIQVRFAGQLAIPIAVLTGLGVVQLLAVVDLARTPVPFRGSEPSSLDNPQEGKAITANSDQQFDPTISLPTSRAVGYLVGIGLLVFGLSLIYVPGLTADVTYSEAQVEAVGAIDEHADAANRTYPENFVLSEWGDNRMYNHFVNGKSQNYGYAQSNYRKFRAGSDPDGWYDQFSGRVGYVIVTAVDDDVPTESAQVRLLEEYGAGNDGTDGLAHYQALYVDDDVAAFAVVPGATLEVSGEPGTNVTVETDVSVSGTSFTYEQMGTIGDDGRAAVTVPYAGEYVVGDRIATVTRDDVLNGNTVALER